MPRSNLDKAKKKQLEMREAGWKPITCPIEKLEAKPTSKKLAIAAKCYDCVGQNFDPGWKDRVRNCRDKKCPLYNFRPYKL